MTDPSHALTLFQEALDAGQIPLQPGIVDKELFLAPDEVNGRLRLSYLRLRNKTIIALVQLVALEPLDGAAYFQLGYAVPEQFRGKGIAKGATAAALAEMISGFGRAGIHDFFVEAIVGVDNIASQRLAAALLTKYPEAITDSVSGKPALRYLHRLGRANA
jgi:hypothetical protein